MVWPWSEERSTRTQVLWDPVPDSKRLASLLDLPILTRPWATQSLRSAVDVSQIDLVGCYISSLAWNDMLSLPILIANSCIPSLFLGGHFESSSLMISLSLMMCLISCTTAALMFTGNGQKNYLYFAKGWVKLTFFPNHWVVSVVGVVCISQQCTSTVALGFNIELCTSRQPKLKPNALLTVRNIPKNSWPNLPECPEL